MIRFLCYYKDFSAPRLFMKEFMLYNCYMPTNPDRHLRAAAAQRLSGTADWVPTINPALTLQIQTQNGRFHRRLFHIKDRLLNGLREQVKQLKLSHYLQPEDQRPAVPWRPQEAKLSLSESVTPCTVKTHWMQSRRGASLRSAPM